MTEFQKKYKTIVTDDFMKFFEKVKTDIMMRIVSEEYHKTTCKELLKSIKEYPEHLQDTMKIILKESEDINAFIVDLDSSYEIFVVDANDISLKDNKIHPGADALCLWINMDTPDRKYRSAFIILGRKNDAFREENTQHLIDHEITHVILDYFKFSKRWDDEFIKSISPEDEEFFADYIPIYNINKDSDFINKYLEYIQKWFKREVREKHHELIKEIILYYNNKNLSW